MNDFNETFKNYSNSELLKIIDSPNDYQPLAVQTANDILQSRQLTDQEIEIAKQELTAQQKEQEKQNQKRKDIENKVKGLGTSVIETINPIQTATQTTDKIIKIISIVFGGIFLYNIYSEYGMIRFMFTDSEAKWDFIMLLYFLPLLVVPTAAILFYTRKKFGWTLLTIFLTYSAVNAILLFTYELIKQPSGYTALDQIFPRTSPVLNIGTIIFFSGILLVVCKKNIREIYNISKKQMISTTGITAIIVGLFIICTYF